MKSTTAICILVLLWGLGVCAESIVVGPTVTNPEHVWEAEYIVLAKGQPGDEGYFETIRVLKGEGFPTVFSLKGVNVTKIRPIEAEGFDFSRAHPSVLPDWNWAVHPDFIYLFQLSRWEKDEPVFGPWLDPPYRAVVPIWQESSWLKTVEMYIEAAKTGDNEKATQVLENWIREVKAGERHLPPGMETDIEKHLATPTLHKSPERLLGFIQSDDPGVRQNAIVAMEDGRHLGLSANLIVRLIEDPDRNVHGALFDYLILDQSSEAMPYLIKKYQEETSLPGPFLLEDIFEAIGACADESYTSFIFDLGKRHEEALEYLLPWWEGKFYGPMNTLLLSKVKGDFKKHPEETQALIGMGDKEASGWAMEIATRWIAAPGNNQAEAELAAWYLPFYPHEEALKLINQMVILDGDLLEALTEGFIHSRRPDRFEWLDLILKKTKNEEVLMLIQFGNQSFFDKLFDRRWADFEVLATEALDRLDSEGELGKYKPPINEISNPRKAAP